MDLKKEYHEPELRVHGDLTVITQDAQSDPFGNDFLFVYGWN